MSSKQLICDQTADQSLILFRHASPPFSSSHTIHMNDGTLRCLVHPRRLLIELDESMFGKGRVEDTLVWPTSAAALYVSCLRCSRSGPSFCPFPPMCLEEGEFSEAQLRVSGWHERDRMYRGSVCRDYLVFSVHARPTAVGKTAPDEGEG